MLLTMEQEAFLCKYLDIVYLGWDSGYKLKDNVTIEDIPKDDLERLRIFDWWYASLHGEYILPQKNVCRINEKMSKKTEKEIVEIIRNDDAIIKCVAICEILKRKIDTDEVIEAYVLKNDYN